MHRASVVTITSILPLLCAASPHEVLATTYGWQTRPNNFAETLTSYTTVRPDTNTVRAVLPRTTAFAPGSPMRCSGSYSATSAITAGERAIFIPSALLTDSGYPLTIIPVSGFSHTFPDDGTGTAVVWFQNNGKGTFSRTCPSSVGSMNPSDFKAISDVSVELTGVEALPVGQHIVTFATPLRYKEYWGNSNHQPERPINDYPPIREYSIVITKTASCSVQTSPSSTIDFGTISHFDALTHTESLTLTITCNNIPSTTSAISLDFIQPSLPPTSSSDSFGIGLGNGWDARVRLESQPASGSHYEFTVGSNPFVDNILVDLQHPDGGAPGAISGSFIIRMAYE